MHAVLGNGICLTFRRGAPASGNPRRASMRAAKLSRPHPCPAAPVRAGHRRRVQPAAVAGGHGALPGLGGAGVCVVRPAGLAQRMEPAGRHHLHAAGGHV